jgi:peptidoglycan-associated lipoprotein
MKHSFRFLSWLSVMGVLALALTGCPKRAPVTPEEEAPASEAKTEAPESAPAAPQAASLDIGTEYAGVPELAAVRFIYMKADLKLDARETLKKNAVIIRTILKAFPSVQVRVEGHCDERGTLEYNMALGQRRANAVRDYYRSFGIRKSALQTISYGEERPICAESNEACWAENRRGETTLKSSQPVKIPLSDLNQ